MKKQMVLFAALMTMFVSSAHALQSGQVDRNQDPNISRMASIKDKAAHPGCPFAKSPDSDREKDTNPSESASAKTPTNSGSLKH